MVNHLLIAILARASHAKLSVCLKNYDLPLEWLHAIWTTINEKILPALIKHKEKVGEERQQREREAMEARKLKELLAIKPEDHLKLLNHLPVLKVEEITKKLKAELIFELRLHRLWNDTLMSPWSLNKDGLIEEVTKAVEQFKSEGREVEDVRKYLRRRPLDT